MHSPSATSPSWPSTDDTLLEQLALTSAWTLGQPQGVWVSPDGRTVLFRRSGPRSTVSDLYELDVATGAERLMLSAEDLLGGGEEQLSVEEKARRERARLSTRGVTSWTASDDGRRLLIPLSGRLHLLERASGQTRRLPIEGVTLDASLCPLGQRVAYVRDGDLFTFDISTSTESRVSPGASEGVSFGAAEFVAQEEMHRSYGYAWSPDGARLAYQVTDERPVEVLHVADATRPEQPPVAFRYPRVGTANAIVGLRIGSATGGPDLEVRWDAARWPYLARFSWPRRGRLTLLVQNRAQTEAVLFAVDPDTGALTELLRETDEAWINLDGALPVWTAEGAAFVWSSEREGAWRLYLHGADGALIRPLTEPDLGYIGVTGHDTARGALLVQASADPRQKHVYRIPLQGGAPERLSAGDGLHAGFFGGGTTVIHSVLSTGELRWSVRDAEGQERARLRSVAESPPYLPNLELTSVPLEGGETFAAIIRPRDFDPSRKYPVLLYVYGGPHASVVTVAPRTYLRDQWFADGGFVVVRVDGRGTPFRGRAWERIIQGDLISTALADQSAALAALGARYPELDLSRVAVTGWSFGGYMSAMAVLLRPETFHAAAAGAPVTDWRDYDTHYTERYMGLLDENAEGYDRTSALTYAASLSRPLLLIHGTTDDNVYFCHSLKLSQALFKAGKDAELLALPGITHMVPDPAVKVALERKIIGFLRRSLPG